MRRSAFTLIELLVVITIIAILVGVAMPYVQGYVADSRIGKAKADLEEIKRALAIYETQEGVYERDNVSLLTGRYLNSTPVDPWGKAYVIATYSGIVFSAGPDRLNNSPDDISVNYQPPLALLSIKWVDQNQSGAVDTQNVPDYLMLNFSRRIATDSPALTDAAGRDAYFGWTGSETLAVSLNWDSIQLASSGVLITISLADGKNDTFAPGSDTFWINDGKGLTDLNLPDGNLCLASQSMVIKSAR